MAGRERNEVPQFDISEPAIAPEIYLDGMAFEDTDGVIRGFGYSDRRLGGVRDHRLQVVVTFTRKNFRRMIVREWQRFMLAEEEKS